MSQTPSRISALLTALPSLQRPSEPERLEEHAGAMLADGKRSGSWASPTQLGATGPSLGHASRSVGTVVAGALLACGGGYPEPKSQLALAERTVRAAEAGGAQAAAQSSLLLRRSKEQIRSARALIEDDENERAEWLLKRAQVDAELALALANESAQRQRAIEIKEELDQLRARLRQRKR